MTFTTWLLGPALVIAIGPLLAGAQTGAITPKVQAPSEARALSRAFAATARALQPSVVRIDVESERSRTARNDRNDRNRGQVPPDLERFFERFFGEEFDMPAPGPGRGTGSGVVLNANGDIITNSHVVENATKVTVTFSDGREFTAKVVGHDKDTDVAVLRLEKPPASLVAARVGDSGKVEVGEWVLAIGSPLGLDQSVTAGIVSGKGKAGRHVQMSGGRVREYIQTDARINPGNSGGPLVNLDGEVIGINTLIHTGPGGAYGFAIPINHARRVAQLLISDGRVRHAYMGILPGDVKDGVRLGRDGEPDATQSQAGKAGGPARAAWVMEVIANTGAAKAGVHVGDIITEIDGQKIESAADVIDYVSSRAVGARISLATLRDGRPSTVQVTLGDLADQRAAEAPAHSKVESESGLHVQTLTPDIARLLGLDQGTKGAVVAEVTPRSRAARAGVKANDVILEIDRKPVATADEATAALKDGKAHLLRMRRGTQTLFITLPAR